MPLGTDAGRAATAARCSRTTSGERAPEERPAGRPAIIYILSALRAPRACVLRALARFARLRVSRARVLRALARFALVRLRRSCAHFYLARVPRVSLGALCAH